MNIPLIKIEKQASRKAFTLVELMIVILIISILSAVIVPIMRGRIDSAKWAEANAAAGMIQNSVKVHFAETSEKITGGLGDGIVMSLMSIEAGDLGGTYFVAADYNIDSVDDDGIATITVTGSLDEAPSGSKTLYPNGEWK